MDQENRLKGLKTLDTFVLSVSLHHCRHLVVASVYGVHIGGQVEWPVDKIEQQETDWQTNTTN